MFGENSRKQGLRRVSYRTREAAQALLATDIRQTLDLLDPHAISMWALPSTFVITRGGGDEKLWGDRDGHRRGAKNFGVRYFTGGGKLPFGYIFLAQLPYHSPALRKFRTIGIETAFGPVADSLVLIDTAQKAAVELNANCEPAGLLSALCEQRRLSCAGFGRYSAAMGVASATMSGWPAKRPRVRTPPVGAANRLADRWRQGLVLGNLGDGGADA